MIAESNYRLQVTIPADLYTDFELLCEYAGLSKSEAVTLLLKNLLYGKETLSNASESTVL